MVMRFLLGTLRVIGVVLFWTAVCVAAVAVFALGVMTVCLALPALIIPPVGIALFAVGIDMIRSGLHPKPMWRPKLTRHA